MNEKTIVDLHCHLAGIGAGHSGCRVSARMRRNWRYNIYLRTFGVTHQDLAASGDHLIAARLSASLTKSRYVSHAVILAMDGVVAANGQLDPDRTEIYVPNEFVRQMAAKHSNLLFGASVNPERPDALEQLQQAKAHGAVLLKWLPNIMHFDPAHPKYVPFYRKLVELDLPLLSHTGTENSFSGVNDSLGDPERLRRALQEGVTVIAAHAGGGGRYQGEHGQDRLARLMREFPNCYADISALTLVNHLGDLHRALRRPEFAGRLLYGSDFPLIRTALVSPWFSLRIPLRERCAITREPCPWDRDVLMKRALGTPPELFARSAELVAKARRKPG